MRTYLLILSLIAANTAPLLAASATEVVAKFEALQKEMFKDPKGGAFDRFIAAA